MKVDRKTPPQVSGPALWYSPDGFCFLLVGVLYMCCSFCSRFLKCFSSLQLAAPYLQLQKEALSCPYKWWDVYPRADVFVVQQEALLLCIIRQRSPVLDLKNVFFTAGFVNGLLKFHHVWDHNSVSRGRNTKPNCQCDCTGQNGSHAWPMQAKIHPPCEPMFTHHQHTWSKSESFPIFIPLYASSVFLLLWSIMHSASSYLQIFLIFKWIYF